MGHPLSLDLRERVVAVVDEGLSRRQAAARFSVSPTSVVRWCQRKASGKLAPARQGGDRRSHRVEALPTSSSPRSRRRPTSRSRSCGPS